MKNFSDLKLHFENSNEYEGLISLNEKIAPKTTIKIGGTAEIYFEPQDFSSLIFVIKELKNYKISYFILGGGSNIVFTDENYYGAVISLNKLNLINEKQISPSLSFLECYAGTSISAVTNFCKKNCLFGFEKFAGLPGSIGGAVFMNARCFEKSISEIFENAKYLDTSTYEIKQYNYNENDWDYKTSPFQDENNDKKIILSATFKLEKKPLTEKHLIDDACKKYIDERIEKHHFDYPSAGSVFKNNRAFGFPSGKIIDDCGLKGKRIGDAEISTFHGNFIINLGCATQKDVKSLVDFAIATVKEKKDITLEPEIIFCP